MNIICCTSDCVYQTEGYCTLEHAASGGERDENGCLYYVQKCNSKFKNNKNNSPI